MITPIKYYTESCFNLQNDRVYQSCGWHVYPAPLDTNVILGIINDVSFRMESPLHNHIKDCIYGVLFIKYSKWL